MKLQGRNLEPNLRGKDVALLQSELKHLKLQTPIVDPDGFFGSTTFLAVQEFQRAHGLAVTGIVDEHTVRTINRVVAAQPRETWVVRGSVLQPDGDPVPKTEVRAFEKHLRSETLLGESSTNGRGEYEIKYPIPKNAALSLIVRAFDSQDKELVASSVICKVSPVEVVDLVVGDEPYRGLSEFKLLQEALMPLLQQESIAVADLSEEDVILLSCQNDLDAEHLAYFVVSERLMSETHLQAEWFYGLVRQSLPTNLIALVAHSPEILRSALETSVRDNIVGIHIFKIIPEILSSLQQQIVRLALHPSEPDRPTLGSLLDIAGVRTTLKEKILSDYLKREGTVEEFWTRLREQPDVGGKMVDSIQYVVQLAAVTLNHEPMVRELIRMRDRRELGADLRDLARLNRDDWQMLINRKVGEKSIGAPSVLGEDESQRTEQYALFLERMVEATFPTTVLGHRLAELDPEKFAPTIAFLRRNPDFDFNTMRLHEYLRERPNAIEGTSTEAPEQLRAVQRMMNIAPAFNKVSAVRLIADGIQSALSVRRMGAPQFLRVHSGQFDNVIEAQQFYIKAARQADTALLLGSMTMGFNPTHITITAPHLFGEGIPDLEDLFGSLDLCQCEQCGSVYSPAAYLVDILHFLMNRPANSPNKTALDVLYGNSQDPRQRRRADIGHIELTCQNTNTLLPYVDLVNEILERVVAPGGESSFQTQAEADVLAANPEHLNVAAYNRLAQAIYPWTLPFSLWAAEVHSYLSQIGTQRYALMEAFIPDNASEFMLDTATEYLGLTPQEREIITDSRTNMTASYWGMETGEFNILLSDRRAAVILQQSGLSYKELTAVLEVHAVNMGTAMRIQFVGADCNLDTATITNLSTERLSRFHRFVRLQRKLGWPILELGNLLEIMNVNELDNSALLFLAQIKRIRGALKPSWEILSTWWNRSNRIDTRNHDGQPSLYDRIFNDPSINPPTLEIFELNSARDELEENNLRISEHVDAVSRAIGINTDDLNLLVAEPDELPNDNLNLANLTRIYSVVTFTRAAKISIREYLIMRALTGLNPLGHEQLTQAERFIQLLQEVRASKMNLAVLDYLLRHQITPDPAVLDESQIHKFLEKLQTSLQKIAVDHTFISDPTGKRVTELLASLLPGELANRVVAILDGSTNENQDVLSSLLNDNLAQFLDPNEAFAQLVSPGTLARPEDRFDYVLERLLPFLARNASDALVIESVASAMGISTEIADDLLRRLVPAPGDPLLSSLEVFLSADFINATDAAFSDQHVTFHRLAKIAIMLNALSISSEHVEFVLRQGPALGWLDLAGLPLETQATASPLFEQWLQQVTLFRAVTRLTTGIAGLLKLISLLDDPALTHDAFFNRLAEFTSWDLTDIEFLAGQQGFDFDFPSGFVDGQFLLILKRCFELLNVMGITAQEARRWATPVVDDGIARAVKQAVRAKYPDQQQWLAIAKPIRDELREQQRAALVGYLVHEIRIQIPRLRVSNQPLAFLPPNLLSGPAVKELQLKLNIFISGTLSPPLRVTSFFDAFTDVALRSFQAANGLPVNGITTEATWAALDRVRQRLKGPEDLYAHFLIDVEMSSCMLTSRIVQATQSVQLFIQRCLLNLEPEVDLTPEDVKEWAWMKNYRVWEANRKVFLYPENWIEPELRDDKTPFFKRLESGLLQDTINDVTVEREYLKYLEELDRVAQLEISGLYRQWETDQDIQHVIGRTRNTPHLYYYRRWINQRYWTPWEKVDVDIEGDHLVPVVWNRRLYLFWPMFMERADEEVEHGEDEPNRFYEIRLAWSEYREGKWNPKQVSKISIKTPSKRGQLPEKFRFSFWSYLYQAGSLVIAYSSLEVIEPLHYAHFKFNGCNSEPEIILSTNGLNHSLKPFSNTDFYYNALKEEKIRQGETSSTSNMFLVVTSGNISRDGTRIELVRTKEQIVLNNTPGTFIIVYPHNERPKICHTPFFFQDNTRTFLVVPRTVPTRGSGGIGGSIEQAIELRPNTVPLELPDKIVSDVAAFTRRSAEPASDSFIDGILAPNDRAIPTAVLAATNTGNRETVAAIMDTTTAASRALSPFRFEAKFFRFDNFYHPYVCLLIEQLNRHGIEGILRPDPEKELIQSRRWRVGMLRRQQLTETFFNVDYKPNANNVLNVYARPPLSNQQKNKAGPVDEFDFSFSGAYSIYNWELFFHGPFMIAKRLSANRRFAEAQRWFHYLFDPTDRPSSGNWRWPERVWQIKPFFEHGVGKSIQRTMLLLKSSGLSKKEQEERNDLLLQIDEWRKHPFKPHLIARLRPEAYMKTVVMAYLDNLIAWADDLFRQDTRESINEATQIYVLASNILGDRPREIAAHDGARKTINGEVVNTFEQLRNGRFDAFSDVLVDLETIVYPMDNDTSGDGVRDLLWGTTDFVANEVLTVNPDAGPSVVARDFEPPDNPGPPLDMATPIPAILGPTLFFCIPKNDKLLQYWDTVADRLFKIRHCMNIEGVERQLALFAPPIDPALLVKAAEAGLDFGDVLKNLNAPNPIYRFQVLAQKASELINDVKSLGSALLAALEKKDGEDLALIRSGLEIQVLNAIRETKLLQIEEAKTTKQALDDSLAVIKSRHQYYENKEKISAKEQQHMDQLEVALGFQQASQAIDVSRAGFGFLPDFDIGVEGAFSSPTVKGRWGSSNIMAYMGAMSQAAAMDAHSATYDANKALTEAGYDRRKEDWDFQAAQAAGEISQFEKQITAAEIRMSIADQDLKNHDIQIENAKTADEFMRNKYTKAELYIWMLSQLSTVYSQSYQLAFDLAKRAERAFRQELGLQDSNYIQFDNWDDLRKGLLSGEKLHHDLRRLETAYLDLNKREFELTKHVSLRQLNPMALLQLKVNGFCDITLPEWLFDLDCPGHYMRRLKTVGVTIPCIVGPYASVNCTLTLQRSTVRISSQLVNDAYHRLEDDATRFVDYFGAIHSVVTSSANNDSGLFEINLRDERFLPFEGSGAESTWRLELPREFRQFDYNTISDVVMHVRYTARQGGNQLRLAAVGNLPNIFNSIDEAEPVLLLSLPQDFPSEWHRFVSSTEPLSIRLGRYHFPYLAQGREIQTEEVRLVTLTLNTPPEQTATALSPTQLGLQQLPVFSPEQQDEETTIVFSDDVPLVRDARSNVFLIIHYTIGG